MRPARAFSIAGSGRVHRPSRRRAAHVRLPRRSALRVHRCGTLRRSCHRQRRALDLDIERHREEAAQGPVKRGRVREAGMSDESSLWNDTRRGQAIVDSSERVTPGGRADFVPPSDRSPSSTTTARSGVRSRLPARSAVSSSFVFSSPMRKRDPFAAVENSRGRPPSRRPTAGFRRGDHRHYHGDETQGEVLMGAACSRHLRPDGRGVLGPASDAFPCATGKHPTPRPPTSIIAGYAPMNRAPSLPRGETAFTNYIAFRWRTSLHAGRLTDEILRHPRRAGDRQLEPALVYRRRAMGERPRTWRPRTSRTTGPVKPVRTGSRSAGGL